MNIYELTVKFDTKWILENQNMGKSVVVDNVVDFLTHLFGEQKTFVTKKEFHQCRTIICTDSEITEDYVKNCLQSNVNSVDENSNICVELKHLDKKDFLQIVEDNKHNLSGENLAFIKSDFGVAITTNEENGDRDAEDVEIMDFEHFIAMEPARKWLDEIDYIEQAQKKIGIDTGIFNGFAYLISINRGNGLSSILNMISKKLRERSLFKISSKRPYIEFALDYDEDVEKFSSYSALLEILSSYSEGGAYHGIVALNIEEWIDHLNDKRFEHLLNFVWKNKDTIMFVFTVPYVDGEIINKINARIDDVISVKTMKFIPPSDKQYFEFFVRKFEMLGIKVDDDVYDVFSWKIATEKNDGRFYGFNTVNKIINEVMYKLIVNTAQNNKELPEVVVAKDISQIYSLENDKYISGLDELKSMVALHNVKNKVQEILSTVKLQREMYKNGNTSVKPCFHMMFTGNPGTGKTVVARIIGRIFKEEGLLSTGNFFEVSRKDFVGKFVGHTAPKTMEICRNALGSVLFIDEAYMLANESDGFSNEAIGTLIAEMENNRDKMVVIFAGYEKEMEKLFEMNTGLKDRIPHKIQFPNYNRDELQEIFFMQLEDKLNFDSSFKERVIDYFANLPEAVMNAKHFSNGRFVRNLVERIISKAALRFEMSGEKIENFCLSENDFDVAVADNDFSKLFVKEKKSKSIGF